MKKEFILAFNEVIEDRQLPREVVMEALEAAMVSAYRKAVNASNAQYVVAEIDPETGKVTIKAEKEVVEAVNDSRTEVSLEEARKVDPEAEIGNIIVVESTPKNFGRVAAQTARQVIQQRIREAEREVQLEYYSGLVDEIVNGIVQAVSSQAITLGLDKRAEGIMPRNQQIPGERFRVHDRVRALLLEVKQTSRGPQIILSRAHRKFLRRLLEDEVPEIYHGLVEIRSIAREPGHRSKVAVAALQAGIDPVGACVGMRGVRIQAIVRELNDEKIDVIEWSPEPAMYIAKALSPARVSSVYLDRHSKGTKTATVVVPEDQLSLAIGRDGQNARLAAKLTGWRIDIKSQTEAAADAIYKLQNDPEYAEEAEAEKDTIPLIESILAKKAAGRPIMPEEYRELTQFVDRVEQGVLARRQEVVQAEKARQEAVRATIPEVAFQMPLETLGLAKRWEGLLSKAGYATVGDLMYQMKIDSDAILALNGIGPKAMQEIETALEELTWPEVEEAEVLAEGMPEAELAEGAPQVEELEAAIVEQPEPEVELAEVLAEVVPGAEGVQEPEALPAEAAQLAEAPDEAEESQEEAAPLSMDEIFTLRPEALEMVTELDEEEDEKLEEKDKKGRRKKKKKRRKYIEMEYDPDKDVTIVRRKRKRSAGEWDEEEWDF